MGDMISGEESAVKTSAPNAVRCWICVSSLLGVALGLAPDVRATTSIRQITSCPVGGEVFERTVLTSEFSVVYCTRLDFKDMARIGELREPDVCPGNGFVLFADAFSPEEIATLEPWVASPEYPNELRRQSTFYRAARAQQLLGHPH